MIMSSLSRLLAATLVALSAGALVPHVTRDEPKPGDDAAADATAKNVAAIYARWVAPAATQRWTNGDHSASKTYTVQAGLIIILIAKPIAINLPISRNDAGIAVPPPPENGT